MKILYCPIIHDHSIFTKDIGDYQSDTLFHGLRSLFGEDVVDCFKMWHLYNDAKKDDLTTLWGKGFTTYGLLPDLEIDRDDIKSKVDNQYYDLIVCPIHHTEVHNKPAVFNTIASLLKSYPKNKIAIVDGWDRQAIEIKIASQAPYFKRELSESYSSIAKPISFSLPKEKIQNPLTEEREFDFAPLVPAYMHFDDPHQETYIYNTEEEYYDMYKDSYFAYTCKKAREDDMAAGWDCMRHYEILACGSVPFFTDIEKCPSLTLTKFPRDLCIRAKQMKGVHPGVKESAKDKYGFYTNSTFIGTSKQIKPGDERGHIDFDKFDKHEYQDLQIKFMEHTRKYLTTEAMAKYFIEEMKKC